MNAPRINSLQVRNFKSVGSPGVRINFPESGALVLLGENNAGKSNISRALELLLGERWPKSYQPDDHDFFGRSPDGMDIKLGASFSNVQCGKCPTGEVQYVRWLYDKSRDGDPCEYSYSCTSACYESPYVSNKIREQLYCMFIGADRRLSYQLSYSSKYTFLSKLMHKFHQHLTQSDERVSKLREIFSQIIAEFAMVDEFNTFRELLRGTAEEFGQNLAYRLDVDFSAYDPSNFFRSLRLHPNLDGEVRSFEELGTGQEQILALAFAYAYAKAFNGEAGLILAIDEPESNLHPVAQQWLASRLQDLSQDGLQVVVTTHSPHFVDLAQPENLVIVRKDDVTSGSKVTQVGRVELASKLIKMGADAERTTAETVGAFYSNAATAEIKAGFFARACVVVEGSTESFALPLILKMFDYDILRDGVAFLPVGGIPNVAKWVRLLTIFGIPVYPIFDTDSDKTGKEDKERKANREDIMRSLGLDESLACALAGNPISVHERFAVMDANFESAAKCLFGERWDELAAESEVFVGTSKPLQARYVTQRLTAEEVKAEYRPMLDELRVKMQSLLNVSLGVDGN